jgi:pimeloyl-ACP methyl ester carboxylesterase
MTAPQIANFESVTANVAGVKLHYWVGGKRGGQPVILWHGFLSTGFAWREVAPALAEAGMSVLIPDMRGYGDSDKPAGTQGYDARALAEECRALVNSIGFGEGKPIIHAAHDMGALPALLWSADHPEEVSGLLYIEAPVMLGAILRNVFTYAPAPMAEGSMWWWILPLAPGVPQRLIVGNERAFLGWFYEGGHVAHHSVFTPVVVNEYLRTFAGEEGVLGSMGVYRAAFSSIEQTEPLTTTKVSVPVVALGGERGLGDRVGEMVKMVAQTVEAHTITDCGHFMPEERPEVVVEHVLAMAGHRA